MRRLGCVVFAWLLGAGCSLYENEGGTLDEGASVPQRGAWETVLDASMLAEGPGAIERVRVGGLEYEGNFANRGDIVVDTWEQDRIRVQMRPFTRSVDASLAAEELLRFEPWAFATEGAAPQRAEDMLVPRPCVTEAGDLREGCALRVLYGGQLQPARAGVDLWVTVPARWTGKLELYTEDNDHDGDYLNRGNICVEGSPATIEATLESGLGFARLVEGSHVSFNAEAANVTVDVPADLTSRLSSTIVPSAAAGLLCSATYEIDNFVFGPGVAQADVERTSGVGGPVPHASSPGVSASVTANDCVEQTSVESPEDYLGPDEIGPVVLHGDVHYCHDCLPAACAQLLPGFE